MKKLITIAALLAITCISKANYLNAVLSLENYDNAFITVSLNRSYFSQPERQVVFEDIEPGKHFLHVKKYFAHPAHPGYQTVFRGYVFINQSTRVNAVITRNHQLRITEVLPLLPPPVVIEPLYYEPQCINYQPACHAVSDYDFEMMRRNIEARNFESTRMQLAKQFVDNNYFSSRQVAELMRTMTFESSKLELAKYAYQKTVDRNNYFVVNDAFTFESSISELSYFISHKS